MFIIALVDNWADFKKGFNEGNGIVGFRGF